MFSLVQSISIIRNCENSCRNALSSRMLKLNSYSFYTTVGVRSCLLLNAVISNACCETSKLSRPMDAIRIDQFALRSTAKYYCPMFGKSVLNIKNSICLNETTG